MNNALALYGPTVGAITTTGIQDFINTQLLPLLLLLAVVVGGYHWLIASNPSKAMKIFGGILGVLAMVALVVNWQTLSTWLGGLFGA